MNQTTPPKTPLTNIIRGESVSEVMYAALDKLQKEGIRVESRNGSALSLYNTNLIVDNPRARTLHLNGRSSNVFQLIAETLWVASGSDVVDGFLEFFLPRAKQYSDDGMTWAGAYGPRMYAHDQFQDVLAAFEQDGLFTRRAVIQIADPNLDSREGFLLRYPDLPLDAKQKDVPCNREIHFFVTQLPDQSPRFNMKVIQRSGDAIFGAGSINPFEFTFIQEMVYEWLKSTNTPGVQDLELGSYLWDVTNFHLYDFTAAQAVKVTQEYQPHLADAPRNKGLTPPNPAQAQQFFVDLVVHLGALIELPQEESAYGHDRQCLESIFEQYDVPTEGNLLWDYVALTLNYIYGKRQFSMPMMTVDDLQKLPNDLAHAIMGSKFTPFKIKLMES